MVTVQTNPDEVRALDEVTARLSVQYPHVPASDVRALVHSAWDEFSGKPIRDFVPVLAERSARQTLANSTAAGRLLSSMPAV